MTDSIDAAMNPALGLTRSRERPLTFREILHRDKQPRSSADSATEPSPENTVIRILIEICQSTYRLARRQKPGLLAAGACALLIGCSDEMVPASVKGYNHMSDWGIASFTVDGAGGPNITPETGGGKSSCCGKVPARWRPGLRVKVQWSYDTTQGGPRPPPPQEAEVEIPEYSSKAGSIQAHFYPNHKVKVVVATYGIEHPRYPMSEEDKLPWETSKQLLEYEKEGRLPE